MLSTHPADPTLTTENLMEVVKEVEDCWENLGDRLRVPYSKLEEIESLYQSDHHRMEAVVDDYIRSPTPSWKRVAEALHRVNHKQAEEVKAKYVKGIDVNHVTSFIMNQAVGGQLLVLDFTNPGHFDHDSKDAKHNWNIILNTHPLSS